MSAPDELWGVIDDNGHPVMVRVSEQRVREYVALTKDVIGMTYEVVRYVRASTAPQGAEPVGKAGRGWIATGPHGGVLHFSEAGGWTVEQVVGPSDAAPQGAEPVAWMLPNGDGCMLHSIRAAAMLKGGIFGDVASGYSIPLYAAPQGAEIARVDDEA